MGVAPKKKQIRFVYLSQGGTIVKQLLQEDGADAEWIRKRREWSRKGNNKTACFLRK